MTTFQDDIQRVSSALYGRGIVEVTPEQADEDHEALDELHELIEQLKTFVSHQSWRCQYPGRYPWDDDCSCGLYAFWLAKFPEEAPELKEWAEAFDPEAVRE